MAPISTSELALRLTALEATGAVRRTMSRYMDLCDVPRAAFAPEALASLFSDNAIWEGTGPEYSGKFGRIEGKEAILAMLCSYLPPSPHFRRNIHLLGEGHITVAGETAAGSWIMQQLSEYQDGDQDLVYSEHFACVFDNISLGEIEPRTFSFNSPHGACPECHGLGTINEFDPELIVNDEALSLENGAVEAWRKNGKRMNIFYSRILRQFCRDFSCDSSSFRRSLFCCSQSL